MAFHTRKLSTFLLSLFGVLMDIANSSTANCENSSAAVTTTAPVGVKHCYKCEDDCNGMLGTVQKCHPDSDSFVFACYTILVDGRPFQRGCTLDFSGGEECVTQQGNTYCFCRTDECNNSLSTSVLTPTESRHVFTLFSLFISALLRGNIILLP